LEDETEWIDGWMDGWMVGWMDGWMDGWKKEGIYLTNNYRIKNKV
jgi:hypothetical protein